MDSLQKPLALFSSFYIRVQSKICGRKSFFFFLPFRILPDFERKFFQTFGRKTSRICQNYLLRVQRNNLWLEIYFKSFKYFWIFCRNLWSGSQVSIDVSRVKFAEETVFWFFFSEFFSDFERNFFQTFGEKSSKSCQNYLLRDQRNNLWLEIFFKSFKSFWIFCRNLWNGSQNSIYVFRVKIAEEAVCLFFFSEFFFRILSESFFRLSAKNLQKVVKTTFCMTRGTIYLLKYFLKVLNRFGFSAETFGIVLKFLYTCPE